MDLNFSCRCGTLRGVFHEAEARDGARLVCYCKDCRAAARHLGALDALEPGGGSPIFQTLPARIEITHGAENLGCLRLSPKGLHRWYATCCDTPVANTGGSAAIPVAGLWRPLIEEPGRLPGREARVFVQQAQPAAQGPRRNRGLAGVALGLAVRGISAMLHGRLRAGPFFDADGAPVAAPRVLTDEERQSAYAE